MMNQRIGNYEEFLEFQRLVFCATEDFVASIDPTTFSDVIVAHPYGSTIAQTFSARVGGDRGISRSDALECWIYHTRFDTWVRSNTPERSSVSWG